MEVRNLISKLTEDALKCINLSIKIALDNNYQQVSIEHLMQALSVCVNLTYSMKYIPMVLG
jgi:hypothetical protein